jgi:hypothetical protein
MHFWLGKNKHILFPAIWPTLYLTNSVYLSWKIFFYKIFSSFFFGLGELYASKYLSLQKRDYKMHFCIADIIWKKMIAFE